MAKAGRKQDRSRAPADKHGGPCCAHDVVGPAVTGSEDVLWNDRLALRVGDEGTHEKCCGPNRWKAVAGAPAVLVNDRAAHRLDDDTEHCGGPGKLVEGS